MTVQETILSFPGLSDFPSDYLSTILAGRAIDGTSEAGTVEFKTLNLVIADTLSFAVNLPNFTENKLSIQYPRDYFIHTAKMLYRQNGEPDKAAALGKKLNKISRGKGIDIW